MASAKNSHRARRLGLEVLEDRIALSSPSDPDPTFGTGGKISSTWTFGSDTVQVTRAAPLADGGLILAGTNPTFLGLLHVQANGTLDSAFGTAGLVRLTFGVVGESDKLINVLSSAGKIVVGASIAGGNGHAFLAAARLNPDGSLDTTFGTGGTTAVDVTPNPGTLNGLAMALPSGGGVILLGGIQGPRPSNVLVRLTSTGAPDPTFGTTGVLPLAFVTRTRDTSTDTGYLRDLAILSDGRIVLAGQAVLESGATDSPQLALARLLVSGGLDPTFGTGGKVTLPTISDAHLVRLEPSGNIVVGSNVVAASHPPTGATPGVLRFTASGQLDTAYGSNGVVSYLTGTTFPYSFVYTLADLAIQADGKAVALFLNAGAIRFPSYTPSVVRLTTTGAFDPKLGGEVGLRVDMGAYTRGLSLAIQPDGKYVVIDQAPSNNPYVFRFLGSSQEVTTPTPAPVNFDPMTATWYVLQPSLYVTRPVLTFSYGLPGWIPVVGDWTGRGQPGIGVVDPATMTWYLRDSVSAGAPDHVFSYGGAGWTPVVGHWSSGAKDGIGVVDPATMNWYLRNDPSAGAFDIFFQYGGIGWRPVVGDWNGSGVTSIGVVDLATETWYLHNGNRGGGAPDAGVFQYGLPGWTPVVGDWTNTGRTGIGVFDPNSIFWYLRKTANAGKPDAYTFDFGKAYFSLLAILY